MKYSIVTDLTLPSPSQNSFKTWLEKQTLLDTCVLPCDCDPSKGWGSSPRTGWMVKAGMTN